MDHLLEMSRAWKGRGLIKKDLHNISRDFNLKNLETLHANEVLSCEFIADQLGEDVLYFKKQKEYRADRGIGIDKFICIIMKRGQKTVLEEHLANNNKLEICMNSTHGMSKGFQATTLMFVTDLNQGFPLSVCFSSTVNVPIITLFLNKVKERVGNLKAHVFMSDCTTIFRQGWLNAMGSDSITHVLTCT